MAAPPPPASAAGSPPPPLLLTAAAPLSAHPTTQVAAGRLGDLTWPVVRDLVDGVVTVGEGEIVEAMALVYSRLKVVRLSAGLASGRKHEGGAAADRPPLFCPQRSHLSPSNPAQCARSVSLPPKNAPLQVVEPSGAVGLAAVLSPQFAAIAGSAARVGVILCGGNVDLGARGLWDAFLK
jgi:hypothetical protein